MLQPSQTSSEDGPSTDAGTGDSVSATSTMAETKTRSQRVESASQLQRESNIATLLTFFDDLSEEEWTSFSMEMSNPASKAEFIRTCMNVARVVHLTSLNIVIPALDQMVDKDLQSRESKSQAATRTSSANSRSSHPLISFIEDDVDVMIVKNGVLFQIIPKRGCSRISVGSSRSSPTLSGSQTSPVDSRSTPPSDELKTSLELTKESVCLNVIRSLGKTLIDCQSQSLGPDLRDFSTDIVEEVAVSIFRALKTFGQRDATVQETKDMIQKVSERLCESLAKKDAARALVSPVKDETLESTLTSTAKETMDAVIKTMEDSLDNGEKSKPAKNILADIRKVVRVLACQSTSLEELKADALTDMQNKSPSLEHICVNKKAHMLFSDEFHSKATLAVSDVLSARGIRSALGINSCLTSNASPVGDVSESKPAASSRSAPALLPLLPQPVGSATKTKAFEAVSDVPPGTDESQESLKLTIPTGNAGEGNYLIAETQSGSKSDSPSGVETPESTEKVMPENLSNESGWILYSAASDLIGHFVDSVQKCEMELSTLKRISKADVSSATSRLYQSLQIEVRQMFAQWNFTGKQADPGTALKDASASGPAHSTAVHGMSRSENAVDPEAFQQVETDPQSPSPDADECTKEILIEILKIYKEQIAEGNCAGERYSVSSFWGPQLIDDIMSSLGEVPDTCIQEDVAEEDADFASPIKKVISSENFERNATAKVRQVLLKSTGSFHAAVESDCPKLQQASLHNTTLPIQSVTSGDSKLAQGSLQSTTLFAQSTALDVVNITVGGIQKLFHLRPSQNEANEAASVLQGNKRAESTVLNSRSPEYDRVTEIWHTSQNVLQMLESTLKDFYRVKMLSCVRDSQRADADAKKAISKVLVTLREELPNLTDFESSDELRLMWKIVNSMIDNVEQMEEENDPGNREAQRSKTPSSVSATADPEWISMCPIVRRTYINMSDVGSDHGPTACITQNTVVKVAKAILTKLGLVKDKSASSAPCDGHSTVPKRVERVLSSEIIHHYSPSLTDEVYCLLLEGSKSPEAMALCAGMNVSDTILLKLGRSEGASRKDSTFQLMKAYSLVSVKYLLLPLFHFSSLQSASQDKVQQASASRSCPTFLQNITGEVPCKRASRSPSQILNETVILVSNIMESDVMKATSLSAEALENDIRPPSLDADHVSLSPSSSSTVLEQPCVGQDKVTVTSMPLAPVDSNNEDYTRLVTLLVIRLLSQVQGQQSLSDDMLDMCRRVLDKVLYGSDAAPGISQNDTCAQVKIHKVYSAINRELVKEFGSEDLVSKAVEFQDSSFEETVTALLRNELTRTRSPVEPVLCPAPNEDEIEEDRKQHRKSILRFLPKMPKINLKKFKISVKKNTDASNKGKPTATASSNTVSVFSSEKMPRKRNLFIRMISALTKKSS